ncbi:MAG TPA: hypothetical protein VMM18_17505 [Gemmatimonadaceae bacterium]|nr:hypothetical protein [Gemmatimonadaceae bacterium]
MTSGPAAVPNLAAAARLRRRAPAIIGATLAGVILAVIIWGAAGADDVSAPPPATVDRPSRSVAILPLRTSSGDRQAAEFVAGLLGELTVSLGRIPGIRMPLRHPADGIADPAVAVVGGADAVDIVVDGVVQRERDRLRVNVRLVSVAADSTMWGGTFEGSADDLFALQRSVADALVAALERAPTSASPASDRP